MVESTENFEFLLSYVCTLSILNFIKFWRGNVFKVAPVGMEWPSSQKLNVNIKLTFHASSPPEPCPSTIFQEHLKVLLRDETLATSFINSVLNQLNWAFSEFIGMLQEVRWKCSFFSFKYSYQETFEPHHWGSQRSANRCFNTNVWYCRRM